MEAIGLNPIRLDRIGLDPIRVNAIKLGVPGAASGSDRPYIDPEVLASLVAVCICDGKSNNDPDRAVIKNLVDPDNPFVISNAAYEGMSGHNGYPVLFGANKTWKQLPTYNSIYSINDNKIHITKVLGANRGLIFSYVKQNDQLSDITEIPSFKIRVSGLKGDSKLRYSYIKTENAVYQNLLDLDNGIHKLPKSLRPTDSIVNESWIGFTITPIAENEITFDCDITIEVLPEYEGAFVTDGKDDLIASTKTVSEMGITDEVTVVSLVHQVSLNSTYNKAFTNYLEILDGSAYIRNDVVNGDKTGIYGYTSKLNTNVATVINNILGDKSDYGSYSTNIYNSLSNTKFSVVGRISEFRETSSVAWYWTIIANKVLTTDQINQVISYFNLDKHVKPDVYYDVKKQGLSNDTPEADWYLKDFSGNGHDMQLYNFAKKLGSGIGKYEVDFNTWIPQSYVADSAHTSNKLHITNIKGGNAILYTKKGANAMKVKITGIQSFNLVYRYIAENDVWEALEVDRDGIYELPASTTTTKTYYTGFTVPYYTGDCDITIEQIPDYEGALVSDGIDDYGKVENLPIYKDYTVAIDRAWTNDLVKAQCLTSKLNGDNFGSFSFELIENGFSSYSFGISNKGVITIDSNKKISYQSKYVYNGSPIISGNNVDGKDLFLFRNRDSYPYYAEAAIWSYILFPYTLSEFLLERQLKRYKLGTLYPNMVEFRPIVKSNRGYSSISYSVNPGEYISVDSMVTITVTLSNTSDKLIDVSCNAISDISISGDNGVYKITGKVVKSPQKIDITIDEYIRYEDIVQPYPAIINLKQDGKTITWGDKLKVGSDIVFVGSANLLPELYTVSETQYNGVTLYPNTIIKVEKSMVFDNARTYLKANEPSCILSPNRLRIPNSSYKILGYIPDLTGKGNHGKLNNFAYTEDSGVFVDGSIKFDSTDDHITIPNIIGGKCVMAKVKINIVSGVIYDQRRANVLNKSWVQLNPNQIAFEQNAVSTYIDGILNHNVTCSDLVSKTVNLTCELEIGDTSGTYQPTIGSSYAVGYTTNINLYEFMLFPDVPNEEEIKELNDVMGIENNIEVS